jgi:dipeptidyl aminopeptidase/acylaminoacyl peptidase
LATSGCATTVEGPREVRRYTIQEFLGTTEYTGTSFSPDNRQVLVSSDASGVFNAYAIPVNGSKPIQLTHSVEDSVFVRGYFPDDERFLFTADQGGNELDHVYVREIDGSKVDLTPGEKLRARFLGWARDDTSFYLATNERNPRYFDVYEYSVDGYSREMIYQNDEGLNFADISPDRRYIALSKILSNADSDVYLYDRETGEHTLLTEHDGDANHFPLTFTVDGVRLLFLTDQGTEFMHLVSYDLVSGERAVLVREDWDVSSASYSKYGKYLVIQINRDARTEVQIRETETGRAIPTLELGAGTDVSAVTFSRDENHMALYASNSRSPHDLFVMQLPAGEPNQLTQSLNRNINGKDLVDGQVVRFASFDGVEIPGILYKPHAASKSNRAPALVWVHGGPGGQSRIGYSALIQYLVNHGYVVFAINNRGSSGYGKTFFHLDDRKHGHDDLDDCVASKRMLIDTGYVDPDRIGIIGRSYGGYMALAALTFRPDEFAAGVDLFGISNWYRTVQSIPPWWEAQRKAMEKEMGSFDNEEFFKAKSPLFHAENIVRPLMVLQGANDPRVLKAESDEIVEAVRANGVPAKYIVFDDEGHGFNKKENRERAYEAILKFLEQYLAFR